MATRSQRQTLRTTDHALIRAAQAGSVEAIGQLLQSCRTYLLAIGEKELTTDLRIKVSASDLVQETFVEGQRSLCQFQGQTASELQAWLRGILIHKLAHVRRRYQGTAARDIAREERQPNHSSILGLAEQLVDNDTPSRGAMRSEAESALHAALARLPEEYRAVIKLRNFDLVDFAEIAVRFTRTEGAVRALWLRAMKRLKIELPLSHAFEPPTTITLPSPVAVTISHESAIYPVHGGNDHGQ